MAFADDVVLALLGACTAQDRAAIEALIDPDCTWMVPGDNEIAGKYVGRAGVLELFGKLRRTLSGPARFEVLDVATSRDVVIVHQYAHIEIRGQALRFKECLVFRVRDGRIVEVEEFPADQAALDRAFRVPD